MGRRMTIAMVLIILVFMAAPALAAVFSFDTGNPDGKIAAASRPASAGKFEIETADDFITSAPTTLITGATFTGLLTGGVPTSSIIQVVVDIYRVFPQDSDVGRTSDAPLFSTTKVPTRVNSPSDTAFATRDSGAGQLNFSVADLGSFTALNSVQPGGIHPFPGQTTGGNGAITGVEVSFAVNFITPFSLPADHYFFVPQVVVDNADGEFFWLSAPKPIVPPGTPFPPGFTDLQSWTRDAALVPDWLRIGTDIVGGSPAPTFNAAFSLTGATVPLPASLPLLGTGLIGLWGLGRLKNFRKS
jgi:hypothetical protein